VTAIIVLGVAAGVALWIAPSSQPAREAAAQPTAVPTGPPATATQSPPPFVPQNIFGGRVGLRALPVPGPRPEDLIILETIAPGYTEGQLIIWRTNGELKTQLFPSVSSQRQFPGLLQDVNSAIIDGMQQRSGDRRELGVVYDATAYGSGSPTSMFVLLRLEGDQWRIVWAAADHTPDWRSSHGRVEFPAADLSELVVRSDSWIDGTDALSDVFHEANSGPHRYFVDTWMREGDSYIRTGAETVPSAYATLVEFMYALGTGDDSGARALVTDASLLDRARSLGLDGAIGKNWLIACKDSLDCGVHAGPIGFHQGPPVQIYFEQRDGAYLISDITSSPSP